MSFIVNKTYTPTCSGALLDAVNADVIIVATCEQIVYLGSTTTDFYFASTLSAPELAALDSLLGSFVCPVLQDPVDTATLNDALTGPDVLWSSDKIISELTTNVDHTNLLNKGTNTHAQIDSFISSKGIADGLASLDASTKVPNSQISGVLAVTDLSTYTSTSGTGAVALRSTITTPVANEVLTWTGANWINQALPSNLLDTGGDGIVVRSGANTTLARTLTAPAAGFTITNANGVAGNPTFVLSNDLAALEGLTGTGFAKRTGTDTWAIDTNTYLTGNQTITLSGDVTGSGATGITATLATVNSNLGSFGTGTSVGTFTVNGKGLITAASNTAITFPVTSVFSRTGAVVATAGDYSLSQIGGVVLTTPSNGQVLKFNGTNWVNSTDIVGTGTVTSVAATAPAAGLTVSGSPITTSGTLTFALANDLAAVEGLATNGIAVRTAVDTWTTRSVAGTAGQITATNGDGVAGNPTLALATAGTAGTYATVTTDTFGRVTSGLATQSTATGGTGLSTIGTANQVLGVNTGATGLEYKTITAGAGITVTPSAGALTIAATGGGGTVTSVGLSAPAMFTVTGSPVTTSGTLALALATQASNTVLAGPTTGTATPTFRTLSLVTNAMSDVAITAPTNAQVLTYNNTTSKWVNSTQAATSYSVLISAWTLISGNQYYADVAHNLGTVNVVISLFNATTNALIQANSIVLTNTNTARITVTGTPAYNIRCNVLANGTTIAAGGSTPSSIIVQQSGVPLAGTYTALNIGGGLAVVNSGSGVATLTTSNAVVLRTMTYVATSLDSPNNADWVVNVLAPTVADATYPSMAVRQFSNTTEQGVGVLLPIPAGATNITFAYKGRAATAPGTAASIQLRLYTRNIPNNAAVGAWSAATNLTAVTVPTNAFYQYYTQTLTLASLSLTAGNLYMFELTRNVGVANNLAANWLMPELTISFT